MKDEACVEFLQWSLPKLRYQWKGFRKVRGQVCKRIYRRIAELELSDLPDYQNYLQKNDDEWEILDSLCHVTISRFYRDRKVFDMLQDEVLPLLATTSMKQNDTKIRCWSAGCCSGEEPYTLKILWNSKVLPSLGVELPLQIIATDRNSHLLERAKKALYSASTVKELPEELIRLAFDKMGKEYAITEHYQTGVEFIEQDIREQVPEGQFHLVLCRNLVFTYFQEDLQNNIFKKIVSKIRPKGFLIIGAHESLPQKEEMFIPYKRSNCIYQKVSQPFN